MGCCGSKDDRASKYAVSGGDDDASGEPSPTKKGAAATKKGAAASKPAGGGGSGNIASLPPRPRLDPKDFQFVESKGEVKIKPAGSINGQAFTIDNCENCDLYVLDRCGQVTIDDCKGCRIFVGPTDGAVFIRNCKDCTLVTVCRQLRTRDCTDCRVSLYCRTRPIVESSTNVGFSCFDLSYPGLTEQMRLSKLSAFHNFWWHIYDFTPKDGNWHLLPASATSASLLDPIPQEAADLIGKEPEQPEPSPVLVSFGGRQPRPAGSYHFAVFGSGKQEAAMQLATSASEQGWLLFANEAKLSGEAAASLATEAGWGKPVGKALAGGTAPCIGLELLVPEQEVETLRSRVKELGGHSTDGEEAGRAFRCMGVDG